MMSKRGFEYLRKTWSSLMTAAKLHWFMWVKKARKKQLISLKGKSTFYQAKVTNFDLNSKMEEAEKWTAFHTYKLPHFGNRSSNRVEGSHSSLKRFIKSSSGTIVMVTEKIDQWYRQRVPIFNLLAMLSWTNSLHLGKRSWKQERPRNVLVQRILLSGRRPV